jgi:hypothetical protein
MHRWYTTLVYKGPRIFPLLTNVEVASKDRQLGLGGRHVGWITTVAGVQVDEVHGTIIPFMTIHDVATGARHRTERTEP